MKNKNVAVRLILIVIIITIAVFYITTIRSGHYWGGDFSQYLHHAKNIVEGNSYEDIGYVNNPYYPQFLGPESYPPVFPLVLAPVYKYFGLDLKVMKIELIIFFLLSLLLIYKLFQIRLSKSITLGLILLLAFNPYFWHYKDYLHLDFIFIFFIYSSLILIDFRERLTQKSPLAIFISIVAGVTIYLATGIKGLGMTLMISLVLYDLLRYNKLSRLTIYTLTSFVLLLTIQYVYIHNDFTYLKNFTFNPSQWFTNAVGYLKANLILWDNGWIKFTRVVLTLLFYTLMVVGYYRRVRTDFSILEIFLPVFFLSLIIYQYRYNQFLMAILPIMVYYMLTGLSIAVKSYSLNLKRLILGSLVLIVFGGYTVNYLNQDYGPVNEGVETPDAISLFKKITESTQKDDICIFWRPRVLTLYTGRPSAIYHEAEDDKLFRFFDEINVSYIITGPVNETVFNNRPLDKSFILFLDHFASRNSLNFHLIYKNSSFKLYRYKHISSDL